MLRFVHGTLLGALVLALGLGSAGCAGETSKPAKPDDAAKRKADMEKMGQRQKEMAEKQGKPGGAADEAGKDKTDANKDKEKKDKE